MLRDTLLIVPMLTSFMLMPIAIPTELLAEKKDDSDRIREDLPFRGIAPVTSPCLNRTLDISCHFRRYHERNRIERVFTSTQEVPAHRHPFSQTKKSFPAFLHLAAVKL
ncbi:hypothetical protein CXP35_11455 [Komagataeibacter xylinus]|nr:hypothetical protein CXP35_11455 [Komagataeibacter xylinus]